MQLRILFFALPVLILLACEYKTETSASADLASSERITEVQTEEKPEETIARLSKLIGDRPTDYGLLEERAMSYFRMDSFTAALKDIQRALQLYPQSPDLYYLQGLFAKSIPDNALSLESFQKASSLGTQDPEVYYELGQQLLFQKAYPQAIKAFEQAAELNSKEPMYIFALGFLEESRGNPSKAVNLYRKALDLDSLFVKALTQIHGVYFEQLRSEQDAQRYNDRLLRHYPSHPLGQYQKGSRMLSKALKTDQLAQTQVFAEAINGASEAFTIAINSDPRYLDAYFSRGFTYLLGGQRIDLATADFQKCLELKPDYAEAHFWLGSIQEKYQDINSALSHYETALRLKPDNQDFIDAVNELTAKNR